MKTRTLFRLGALMLLIGVISVPAAFAQAREVSTWNITEPTDVGGTILQPGTYRLTLVPSPRQQNMVRVTSAEGTTVYTTILTVPHKIALNEEVPNSMFVYYPAIEGQPRALRTWFSAHPASGNGHDIVYEEERATLLARTAKAPVVSYRGTVEETTELHLVTPEARVETYVVPETTTVTTIETQPTAIAEVRTEPAPEPAPMVAEERTALPQTAGSTPLFAFLGLLSIAGAFAFRALNR